MRFLLDTNVVSEVVNLRIDRGVHTWMQVQEPTDLAVSALAFGEINRGLVLMSPGKRKDRLQGWLDHELPRQFKGRVLPIGADTSLVWGRLTAEARQRGRQIPIVDGLLVATALVHGLTLVTRNERDCDGWGAPTLNPWSGTTRD